MAQHQFTVRIRYSECDPMGIAHHASYPVWFEMGRTELCRSAGVAYRDMEELGAFIAVARLEVRYVHPIRYDDEVEICTTLERATRVKAIHAYRILRAGLVVTTASTTVACVGPDGRPREMPEPLRRAMGVSEA